MDIKSYCPNCGVHTVVQITQEETVDYKKRKKLPKDFEERAICTCCLDDGYSRFSRSHSLYGNLLRA